MSSGGLKKQSSCSRKLAKKLSTLQAASRITACRKDYVKRLRDFELDPDPDNDHVFSPGYLLARYLQARHFKKKIFLVGKKEQSISEELDEVGISSVWSEDSNDNIKSGKNWSLKHDFTMLLLVSPLTYEALQKT